MKKLVLLLVVLFLGLINAKGLEIVVECGDEVKRIEYVPKKYGLYTLYDLSPFEEYQEVDLWRINNIAATNTVINLDKALYKAIVQKVIWQETCPECNIYVIYQNNVFDDTYFVNYINDFVESFNRPHELDGNSYEISMKEKLTINASDPFTGYMLNNYSVSIESTSLELSFFKAGTYELEFYNTFNVIGDSIYAISPVYKPFTIDVNVVGNTGIFNVLGKREFYYEFDMYDNLGNFLDHITVNNENNKFYFEKDKDIILKDVSSNEEKLDDITITSNDEDLYEITLDYRDNIYEISFITNLVSYDLSEITNVISDLTVKDELEKEIAICKNTIECMLKLKYGIYNVIDNVTGIKTKIEIDNSSIYEINRYYLNGIMSDEKIISILKDDKIYEFNHIDNKYITDKYLEPGIYLITTDKEKYPLDLNDSKNYIITDNKVFYSFEIPKIDSPKEDEKETINDKKEENEVEIKVPNTQIYKNSEEYYYDKKKYYYLDNYYFTNIYK